MKKSLHYSAGGNALHMFHEHYTTGDLVVQILNNSNFCASFLRKLHEFAHSSITAAPLDFRSCVHRSLKNTETMLFGVCFAFPMCIHKEVECFMTD